MHFIIKKIFSPLSFQEKKVQNIPIFTVRFLCSLGCQLFNPKFPAIFRSLSNFQGSHGSRDKINKQSLNVSSNLRFPLIPDIMGKLELISFLFKRLIPYVVN